MAIVALVSFVGCKDSGGDPVAVTPPSDEAPITKDDSVTANAHMLRDALEEFALVNGGVYPIDNQSQLPDGRTIIDFLPGSERLLNPFTYLRDSPVRGLATHQGKVGHSIYINVPPYGYTINAIGEDQGQDLIVIVKPVDPWS